MKNRKLFPIAPGKGTTDIEELRPLFTTVSRCSQKSKQGDQVATAVLLALSIMPKINGIDASGSLNPIPNSMS